MTTLFDAKPFLIAEVGSNWETLEHCLFSISSAKACGADAVKFQAFNHEALYGWKYWTTECLGDGHVCMIVDESKELAHALPIAWLPKLKAKADSCGIELMVTAFSPELVAAVDPYVEVHKIASSDLAYPQLLKAVAKTGKPVLLSTGASTWDEITRAVHLLEGIDSGPIVLLYCVAAYPALHVDMSVMIEMMNRWPAVGFSDHTPGISVALESTTYGPIAIEKHFTAFPELATPDREHSLLPEDFKRMVDIIRGSITPTIGPTHEEDAMLLRHNRRLIATKDIAVGDALILGDNFGAYRSLEDDTEALSPFEWETVQGRPAKEPRQRGKPIRMATI